MTMQGNLSVDRMCQLAEVSRASFYRSLKEQAPTEEDVCNSADRVGTPVALRIAANRRHAAPAWNGGESQAGLANDAGG
jgi:hypothetical protein